MPSPMLLALDTATRSISIALHDGDQLCAEMTWQTANQHTISLMPAIQELMTRTGIMLDRLTLLAVSQGPGSFNGLRIGFSAVKGLAFARQLPLVAIPTLDVVAASQPGGDSLGLDSSAQLLAFLQVGRGRVCAQHYMREGTRWQSQHDIRIAPLADFLAALEQPTILCGELDSDGRSVIESAIIRNRFVLVSPAQSLRRAGYLAELAWGRWRANPVDEAMTATPFYLHQAGATHP